VSIPLKPNVQSDACDRGWNNYGYDAGWVNGIVPQVVYAPADFDYYNAPNYYDPIYSTVYIPAPIWETPVYYSTITVEAPAPTLAPDVSIKASVHSVGTESTLGQLLLAPDYGTHNNSYRSHLHKHDDRRAPGCDYCLR